MAGPIKISILGDTKDLGSSLDQAAAKMDDTARAAGKASDKIDRSFNSAADSVDEMGSKSSQAAGGVGDLGGALALMPGPLGALGAGMEAAAPAIMGVTGAADLMNLAMNSTIVTTVKSKAATIGKTVAEKAAAAGTKAMAAAQWVLNAAMTANPLGLVVLALAALVVGLVVAYKKSDTFRAIVNKAFGKIKDVTEKVFPKIREIISKVFGAVKKVFQNIPIVLVIRHWDTIKDKTRAAFQWVNDKVRAIFGGTVGWVRDKVGALVGFFTGLPGKISRKVAGAFDGLKAALRGALSWIVQKWNGFDLEIGPFKIPDWVPKVGGNSFHIPDVFPDIAIPGLAKGGIVTGPTLALIGEGKYDEAVIPLDGRTFGNTYRIYVTAPVGSSSADIGRELVRHITAYERAGGRRLAV